MVYRPDLLTWTCMVCGEERPDEYISVAQHDIVINGQILPGASYNQRYCNDRSACWLVATKPGPWPDRLSATETATP